jgi:hypothetical protein
MNPRAELKTVLGYGVRASFDHAQKFLGLFFTQFFDLLESRRLRGFTFVFGARVQGQQIEVSRVMIRGDFQRAPQEFSRLFVLSLHQVTLPEFGQRVRVIRVGFQRLL